MKALRLPLLVSLLSVLLTGCGGEDEPSDAGPQGDGDGDSETGGTGSSGGSVGFGGASGNEILLPPEDGSFDYQIGGGYEPPAGVVVLSRDREDVPAPGLYNICYVNGFQTQPSEQEWWLAEHPDLLLRDAGGEPIVDEDWGELLFDTSTSEKRAALAAIVGEWILGCEARGFDAVEVDNLDSYSRSDGLLSPEDNVAFMALLSEIAHENGLASGQKNSTEVLSFAEEMGTDFAVAEECNRWDECADYQEVYGDRVYVIEYREQDFDKGCAEFPELSIVLRDLDVTTPDSGTYIYEGC